jgi:2-dehydropantoate 2-reductase
MLFDAGSEVTLVDVNKDIVAAINANGVAIVRRDGREDTYAIPATADPASLAGAVDVLLFLVKGFATASATALVAPLAGPDTIIASLQNGIGNEAVLRTAFPDQALLLGVSVHSASMTAPGRYLHTGTRSTAVGPAEERWYAQSEPFAEALRAGGYDVDLQHEVDIRREIFAKWVINCGSLPTLAITGLATDAVNDHEVVLALIDALTHEACELAALEGVELDAKERAAFNRGLFQTAGGKASMLQDIEAGRRTEIDTISGAAVRLADKHGHPAPLSRAAFALVKGREAAMGIAA